MSLSEPSLAALPRYLYKFRSLASSSIQFTKRIIEYSELYFACPLDFNDPFECYFSFDRDDFVAAVPALAKQLSTASTTAIPGEVIEQLIERFRVKTRSDFLKNVGVVSLTRRYDSTLMWSHYADGHKGICLEFDLEAAGPKTAVLPVAYVEDALVGKFSDFESLSGVMTAALYHKSADWAYERECRLIRLDGSGPKQFPQTMLSGVIFGSQSDNGVAQDIYDSLSTRPNSVRIGKAVRDPFSYNTRVVHLGDSRSGLATQVDDVRLWDVRDSGRA